MKQFPRSIYAILGVLVLLCAGMVYAWSVMARSIGASRDWSSSQLSLTFTLVMCFFCLGGMVAGFLASRFSPRIFLLASAVLFAICFFVASTAGESPTMLYLGCGFLGGLAAGFAYNAIMSTMSKWYPDKQGMISGVMLMGFGISAFVVGKIFAAVTPEDGSDAWQLSFKVMGIVILIIVAVCGILFAKPNDSFAPPAPKKQKAVREPAAETDTLNMIKNVSFWFYFLWAIFISAIGLVLISQASGIASEVGTTVSPGTIATVVGLISVLNGVGRVFFGIFFDKKGYRLTMLLVMIIFAAAIAILILALKTASFSLIVTGFVVGGFAYGGVTPTNSAIISDFFGRKNYPTNFSIINLNLLVASFASTIAGKLYDMYGTFMAPIIMMVILMALSLAVYFGVRRPKSE